MSTSPNDAQSAPARHLRYTDPHKAFENALAKLAQTQERLRETREKLAADPVKITSKDGMIAITLDPSGEVASIEFRTSRFRRMAPAELGAALTDVLRKARTESRDKMVEAYRPFLPEGMDPGQMMSGNFSVDSIFASARERSEQAFARAPKPVPAEVRKMIEEKGTRR